MGHASRPTMRVAAVIDDVQAIKNLVYSYAEFLDTGDFDGLAALFERARVTVAGSEQEFRGSDAARSLLVGTALLDDPLRPDLLDRPRAAAGPEVTDPGTAYVWAKRGVQRLVRREAVAFGAEGARICSVSPGIIDTPMGRRAAATRPTNDLRVERTPLRREGRPEEVAAVVAFLLSEQANFVSGIDVPVDGGVVAALRG